MRLSFLLVATFAIASRAALQADAPTDLLARSDVQDRGLVLPGEANNGFMEQSEDLTDDGLEIPDDAWEADEEDGEWQDMEGTGLMMSADEAEDPSHLQMDTADVALDRRGRLSVLLGKAAHLAKRARFSRSKARVTWYGGGMLEQPACFGNDWTPNGSKSLIAAPTQKRRWSKRPHCGTFVQLKRGRKKVTVRVVDACATCKGAWFDLSKKAFARLYNPNTGVGKVQWRKVKPPSKHWSKSLYGPKKINRYASEN